MKLVLISDTHEQHDKVKIPECDVLVHAGDLTYKGEYSAVQKAVEWLVKQPAKHIVLVAGNHDFLFEKYPQAAGEIISGTSIHYLENKEVTIDGIKFWGSPVTPWFYDWAFNVQRGADIKKYWDMIPADTDVLITHGPPRGILDQAAPKKNTEHCGCDDLLMAVKEKKPKIHVFGHIHGGYGWAEREGTMFYNASVVDEAYRVFNQPFVAQI